jgi:hypothetical protein
MKHTSPHELCGPWQDVETGQAEPLVYTSSDGAASYPIEPDAIELGDAPGLEEIALVPAAIDAAQTLFASIACAAPDKRLHVFCRVARDLAVLGRRGLVDWPAAADCLTEAAQAHGLVPTRPGERERAFDEIQATLARAWHDAKAAVEVRPDRRAGLGKIRMVGRWNDVSKTYDGGDGVASAGELQGIYETAIRRRQAEHGAPDVTLEALMWAFRESGGNLSVLKTAPNKERLSRLSARQCAELRNRMKKWIADHG